MTKSVNFDGQKWTNATADANQFAEPSAGWPARFAAEVETIRALLGDTAAGLRFEHVGSTAIPGLVAKPIIDILVIPAEGSWPKEMLEQQLPIAGYVFWAENPDPRHLFFVKGMPPFGTGRTHHLHVRPAERAAPGILFRDYLRARPESADEYAALKRELSNADPHDREAYTRGKDAFVADVLRRASDDVV